VGADVERRLIPNQGIRQSAMNIWRFAMLGGLLVGLPYGLLNLAVGVASTRTSPTVLDWLHLAGTAAVVFGFFGGLVPAAACFQLCTLRSVLWRNGSMPWNSAMFLNYATDRALLQRIGGRYRFVHVLLRDHLAGRASSPPPSGRSGQPATV